MDFELSEKAIDFRSQVKSFIENNLTSEIISKMHKTGTFNDKSFNEALASEGLLAGAVPGYGIVTQWSCTFCSMNSKKLVRHMTV